MWLYHSHTNELKDVESGLIGAIIVTRRGMADANGKPKDVDREFVCLYMLFDENQSWYIDHNIQTYTGDPKGVNKFEFKPADGNGNLCGHRDPDSRLPTPSFRSTATSTEPGRS